MGALTVILLPWLGCSSSGDTEPGNSAGSGATTSAGALAFGGTPSSAGAPDPRGGQSGSAAGGAAASGASGSAGAGQGSGAVSGGGSGGRASAGASGASGRAGSGGVAGSVGSAGSAGSSSAGSAGSAGTGAPKPSSGCGKAAGLMNGRASMDVGGTMREYILALPNDYDQNRPYRLVFGWHPLGGSAQQVSGGGYYGLQSPSNGTAIFVAPEGLPFQGNNLGWGNSNGRDIAFLEAMLERFRAQLCIDEDRIFSTGFSFGGMFSFAAGCAPNGMMRAIAPMAGNTGVSGCLNATRPVAVMGFHGTEDQVVGIDGGRMGRDEFVERNQCTSQATPVTAGWCEGVSQNYDPCECVSYQGCTAGYPVIWCEFNGSHMPAPSSGATIWNFFAQF